MALVLPYGDARPQQGRDVFLAPSATLVGDVVLGDEVNVWFGAVLRGDVGPIRVGARTNIQDRCCLHMTGGVSQVDVGCDVTVGHGVTLHGCAIGDGCLVGIGCVVLDNARIGEQAIVAAGAVVPPGMRVPPRTLVRGVPARIAGPVTAEQSRLGRDGAAHYLAVAARYRAALAAAHRDAQGPGAGRGEGQG